MTNQRQRAIPLGILLKNLAIVLIKAPGQHLDFFVSLINKRLFFFSSTYFNLVSSTCYQEIPTKTFSLPQLLSSLLLEQCDTCLFSQRICPGTDPPGFISLSSTHDGCPQLSRSRDSDDATQLPVYC